MFFRTVFVVFIDSYFHSCVVHFSSYIIVSLCFSVISASAWFTPMANTQPTHRETITVSCRSADKKIKDMQQLLKPTRRSTRATSTRQPTQRSTRATSTRQDDTQVMMARRVADKISAKLLLEDLDTEIKSIKNANAAEWDQRRQQVAAINDLQRMEKKYYHVLGVVTMRQLLERAQCKADPRRFKFGKYSKLLTTYAPQFSRCLIVHYCNASSIMQRIWSWHRPSGVRRRFWDQIWIDCSHKVSIF